MQPDLFWAAWVRVAAWIRNHRLLCSRLRASARAEEARRRLLLECWQAFRGEVRVPWTLVVRTSPFSVFSSFRFPQPWTSLTFVGTSSSYAVSVRRAQEDTDDGETL